MEDAYLVEEGTSKEKISPVEPSFEQSCGGFHEKDEARRIGEVVALREPMNGLLLHSALAYYLSGMRDIASRRAFSDVGAVVDGTVMRMDIVFESLSGSEKVDLTTAARARLGAMATCMGIASDDISWCSAMDGAEWDGERVPCQAMYHIYRRIVSRAILGKQSCDDAMEGSLPILDLDQASWVKSCEAVKTRKPDGCPWSEDSKFGALCRSAAAGDGRQVCKVLSGLDDGAKRESCCVKLGWRLATVISGMAQPGFIPEKAALDGDVKGCAQAMEWGLFQDVAFMFSVPDVSGSVFRDSLAPGYLCRFQVHHSTEPMPGQ